MKTQITKLALAALASSALLAAAPASAREGGSVSMGKGIKCSWVASSQTINGVPVRVQVCRKGV